MSVDCYSGMKDPRYPVEGAGLGSGEKPLRAIPLQLRLLDETVSLLDKRLADLDSRLLPVLSPEPPSGLADPQKADAHPCEYAACLASLRAKLTVLSEVVLSMTNRLEV